MITVPFYAYVKDTARTNNSSQPVFHDSPLLIFAMYNGVNGLNFVYELNGQIKSVTGGDLLFSHLQGEKADKVVVLIGQSSAFAIPKKEAIAKGYMKEEIIEIEEEEENEEVIESKPSPNKGQKSKRTVSRSNSKK